LSIACDANSFATTINQRNIINNNQYFKLKKSNMKKVIFILSAVLIQTVSFAQQTWKSDKAHSKLAFSVTHMGISDVSGLFKTFDVTITTSKPDFSDAVFELNTDVTSISTESEMRDNHLKSADFFDAANFPKLTFKSTSIVKVGDSKYKLTGDLTLHGVTKSVTLDLWYRGTITNPMSKAPTAGFQLTGTIKRTDFNIGSKFPSAMLSDDVAIKADGEFAAQ
jgi:polyisoprenoid-binding protein YceI